MTQNYFIARLRAVVSACVYTCALCLVAGIPTLAHAQQPQWPEGIHQPQIEDMKNSESGRQDVVQRLQNEQPNRYRGGAQSAQEVVENMKKLFGPILLGEGQNVDKWYSPYLRDAQYPSSMKQQILPYRYKAGAAVITYIPYWNCFLCFNGAGGLETACPICQPQSKGGQGCLDDQEWLDEHLFPQCCGGSTAAYKDMTEDSNFRTCCVRKDEEKWDTELIACTHPKGDGWSGVFEYYYPTAALGWENDRTTSLITEKSKVDSCLGASRPLMHGQQGSKAVEWVEKAITKNLTAAEKLQGGSGAPAAPTPAGAGGAPGDLKQKIQDGMQAADQVRQDLQFSDSLQGQGLTLRVNFPAMDPEYRKKLAEHFCMHPDQFMKLMDPSEDPLQKGGGSTLQALHNIPVWSNYCPEGVQLMTDPQETMKCRNIDNTPTNFLLGMQAWDQDPMYCQRMNLSNPAMQEYFGETLGKSQGQILTEQQVGYTCMRGGKLNGSLVPVELYRYANVERRAAIGDTALGFLIAGGLYEGSMRSGIRSYYKRFEPQPYSMQYYPESMQIFVGKPFKGSGSGQSNELKKQCKAQINGRDNYFGQNKSDQLFISAGTHENVFPGDREMINEEAQPGFNRSLEEWAQASGGNRVKVPNRGLDEKSNNYAAVFRLFATCPAKYVRWHPPGIHDTYIQGVCRDENLGGLTPK